MSRRKVLKSDPGDFLVCYHTAVKMEFVKYKWLHNKYFENRTRKGFRYFFVRCLYTNAYTKSIGRYHKSIYVYL